MAAMRHISGELSLRQRLSDSRVLFHLIRATTACLRGGRDWEVKK